MLHFDFEISDTHQRVLDEKMRRMGQIHACRSLSPETQSQETEEYWRLRDQIAEIYRPGFVAAREARRAEEVRQERLDPIGRYHGHVADYHCASYEAGPEDWADMDRRYQLALDQLRGEGLSKAEADEVIEYIFANPPWDLM